MRHERLTDKLMQTPVNYGGEIVPLGQVWVELQKIAPNQACVDRYIQGLLSETKRPARSYPSDSCRNECSGQAVT